MPTGNKKRDVNLPGMGGVFNSINLDAYHYAGDNPVKYVDPDGNIQIDMNQIREGDIILRKEGSVTKLIQNAGQKYGHGAMIKSVNKDSKGKVVSAEIIDMGADGVVKRTLSMNGDGESLSEYDAFRVGTLSEGKAAVARAETGVGNFVYDGWALAGLIQEGYTGIRAIWASAGDNKIVCTEFLNWAYEGKFGPIFGTTPDRIYEGQQFLGWETLPAFLREGVSLKDMKREYEAWKHEWEMMIEYAK